MSAGYDVPINQYYTMKFNCSSSSPFYLAFGVEGTFGGDGSEFGLDNQTDGDAFLVTAGEAIATALTNATGASFGTVTFAYFTAPQAPRQVLP